MKKTALLFSLILFAACAADESFDGAPVGSTVLVEPREILAPGARHLALACKTEKIYPCVNYPIVTQQAVDGKSLKVSFVEVAETVACLTALGPATALVDLDDLETGEYALELNNGAWKNRGVLRISNTHIEMDFRFQKGIDIVTPRMNRIPENTLWGIIGYTSSSSIHKVEEFIEKLGTLEGVVVQPQTPGTYSYYEIDGHGELVVDQQMSGYYFAKGLIFQHTAADESQLMAKIDSLASLYADVMSITLNTDKGDRIYNWD